MSIVDVNVLLPLLIHRHPAHRPAREWFDAQSDGTIGWCLPVKLAMLRLLCNPRVMGADIQSPEAALNVWNALAANPRLVEIARIPSNHGTTLRRCIKGREPLPNLWTDAWLAALALCLERDLVTFDRGFRNFEGLRLRLLHVGDT